MEFLQTNRINITVIASLLRECSWAVKVLYYLKPFWKTTMWYILFLRGRRDNHTLATSVCVELLLCIAMVTTNLKKTWQYLNFFSCEERGKRSFKRSRCSNERYSEIWRHFAAEKLSVGNWIRCWKTHFWTSCKSFRKKRQKFQVFSLEQAQLRCQKNQRNIQSFPMQHQWHIFFKDWYSRFESELWLIVVNAANVFTQKRFNS